MSFVEPKLAQWIRNLAGDITSEGCVNRLEVWHAVAGMGSAAKGERIAKIPVDENVLAEETTAQEIWDACEQDAANQEHGLAQRYAILAFRGDTNFDGEPDKRFLFTLRSRGIDRSLFDDSTPPNETGIAAQMLRHDIEKDRLLLLYGTSTAERQERELNRKDKLLERYEARMAQMAEHEQDLLDRKAERQLRQNIEERKAQRMDEISGMVMGLGPILMGQIFGIKGDLSKGADLASKMRDTGVGKVLKSLTEEEFMAIVNHLKPERQMAFLELYKSYMQDEKKNAFPETGTPAAGAN